MQAGWYPTMEFNASFLPCSCGRDRCRGSDTGTWGRFEGLQRLSANLAHLEYRIEVSV